MHCGTNTGNNTQIIRALRNIGFSPVMNVGGDYIRAAEISRIAHGGDNLYQAVEISRIAT